MRSADRLPFRAKDLIGSASAVCQARSHFSALHCGHEGKDAATTTEFPGSCGQSAFGWGGGTRNISSGRSRVRRAAGRLGEAASTSGEDTAPVPIWRTA